MQCRQIPDICIPMDWKLFPTRQEIEHNLAESYTTHMMAHACIQFNEGQVLYIRGGKSKKAVVIRPNLLAHECLPLFSNHREVDTRIILNAKCAAENGATTIVVRSPDTDMLVLL